MKIKKIMVYSILFLIFALIFQPTSNVNDNLNSNIQRKLDPKDIENIEPKTSLLIDEASFADQGLNQDVILFYGREEIFFNQTTNSEFITISNPYEGWNMTNFNLNFTGLSTNATEVKIQTRVDDSDMYDNSDIYYANSFVIPNNCYLRNISMFIQIPGPKNTGQPHNCRITVYNATEDGGEIVPDKALHEGSDETYWDMGQWDQTLPVRWYQANFTNRLLDISKTVNNTFFAVFEMLAWNADSKYDGYFFYANDELGDLYESKLMRKNQGSTTFNELSGKTGTFKIRVAPLSTTPTPEQINLSVFNNPINSTGIYIDKNFRTPEDNEFDIPISSLWFAPVEYNVTFNGRFEYKNTVPTNFNATVGKNVIWSSQYSINNIPESPNYKNKMARFYKPNYWVYNCTYKQSNLFNDSNVLINDDYIELLNISNNIWKINYNQTNSILAKTVLGSSDQNRWYNLNNQVNITDFVNVSIQVNSSNGIARMRVKTNGFNFIEQENISSKSHNFPIWSPELNTTAQNNNSQIDILLMVSNGTMAGVEEFSLLTILSQLNITLKEKHNDIMKNEYAHFHFLTKNLYNSRTTDIDNIILQYEKSEGIWETLVQDYHYIFTKVIEGEYNLTLSTNREIFLGGFHRINLTFESQYYFDAYYTSNLTIGVGTHNVTVVGASQLDRVFQIGDIAYYYLYLSDTSEGQGVLGASFELWVNFSEENGGRQKISALEYSIADYDNGSYTIAIYTSVLYEGKDPLENLTVEFYSSHGLFQPANINDTLKITYRTLEITVKGVSETDRVFRIEDIAVYSLYINDSSTGGDVSSAQFELWANFSAVNGGRQKILTTCYSIVDYNNGSYDLSILTDKLYKNKNPLENLTLEFYARKPGVYLMGSENDTLKITLRTFEIMISGANKPSRLYLIGDYATYYVKINDTTTDEGVLGAQFEVWANFSAPNGGYQQLNPLAFNVIDRNNGSYEVVFLTGILYSNKNPFDNLTLEFYAFKSGVYLPSNENDILKINLRSHEMTVKGANKPDRTYLVQDEAIYYLYLNDSDTSEAVLDADFNVWVNFSSAYGGRQQIESNIYVVIDYGNGSYAIKILTDLLYSGKPTLENVTVEFYSFKNGLYLPTNQNDTLKVYYRTQRMTILGSSRMDRTFTLGDFAEYYLYLNDTITGNTVIGATFTIRANFSGTSEIVNPTAYDVQDENNGSYTITIFTEIFYQGQSLNNLTIEFYAKKLGIYLQTNQNDTLKIYNITHETSLILQAYSSYNFNYGVAQFITIQYYDNTSALNVTGAQFLINNGTQSFSQSAYTINEYPNKYNITFNLVHLEPGYYNLSIQAYKPYTGGVAFDPSILNFNFTLDLYPSQISVPPDYQNLTVYQEQDFEIIVIAKDTFRDRDIINATIKMNISGIFSGNFTALASDFGWYRGTLNIGFLTPGAYIVKLNLTAKGYVKSESTVNITVKKKIPVSIELLTDFKSSYVWGEGISLRSIVTKEGLPISDIDLTYEVIEHYEGGGTKTVILYCTTDEQGICETGYAVAECVFIEIRVVYDGSVSLLSFQTSNVQIEIQSSGEYYFGVLVPYIPFLIGAMAGVSGYKVLKTKKKKQARRELIEKARIYSNAYNIEYILILHKVTGGVLYQNDIAGLGFDANLIGGLLQAITSFSYGIQHKKMDGKEQSKFLFDYQDYKIMLRDGEYARAAFIVREEPSESLQKLHLSFIEQFEAKFKKLLVKFSGDLKPFRQTLDMARQLLRIDLLEEVKTYTSHPKKKLTLEQEKMANLAITFGLISEKEKFIIGDLINYLNPIFPELSWEEITGNVFELFEKGYLIPARESE